MSNNLLDRLNIEALQEGKTPPSTEEPQSSPVHQTKSPSSRQEKRKRRAEERDDHALATLKVTLSPPLAQKLTLLKMATGISKSEAVAHALELYLSQDEIKQSISKLSKLIK